MTPYGMTLVGNWNNEDTQVLNLVRDTLCFLVVPCQEKYIHVPDAESYRHQLYHYLIHHNSEESIKSVFEMI